MREELENTQILNLIIIYQVKLMVILQFMNRVITRITENYSFLGIKANKINIQQNYYKFSILE